MMKNRSSPFKALVVSVIVVLVCIANTVFSFSKPKEEDRYWVISASGREIYLSSLIGLDKQIIFDKVGEDQNTKIVVITSSYNGKMILCKAVRNGQFSYWLVNMDNRTQEKIVDGLVETPYNTMISRDGNWVAFQTDAYEPWLYQVRTKKLSRFDSHIKDGYVSDVRFSFDSKQALYIKLKFINQEEYFTCLCMRDLEKNRDIELTDEYDGSILSAEYFFDNERVLLTRVRQRDEYITLWEYNLSSARFKQMVSFPGEHISLGSPSKDGKLLVFCSFNPEKPSMINFWAYRTETDPVPIFLKSTPSGLIGLRLSHDGKYVIFGTSASDTFIAETDGSWSNSLSKMVDLPNLRDANFYNHPPFPPRITAKSEKSINRIDWEPSMPGTYEVAGYKIYRSHYPDEKDFNHIGTVNSETLSFSDMQMNYDETYYYMVRAFDTDLTESSPSNTVLVDRIPPVVEIRQPMNGTWFAKPSVFVSGIATDSETGLQLLRVDGKALQTTQDGQFSTQATLIEGANRIEAEAIDKGGNSATDAVMVYLDSLPPVIERVIPSQKTWTNQRIYPVQCKVSDTGSGIRFIRSQNREKEYSHSSVDFSDSLSLQEGDNQWIVEAEDQVGNQARQVVDILLDTIPPVITVDFPQDNQELYALDTYIRGNIKDVGSGVQAFTINQERVDVSSDGSFRHSISILEGEQTFHLEAEDAVGNRVDTLVRIKGVKKIVVQLTIGQQRITVNGTTAFIDAPPFIHHTSGRTMVPIRFVVEPIGGKIDFDSSTQKITLLREKVEIILWIGNNRGLVNGQFVPIDQNDSSLAPMIRENRTFLPLRFVSENIGFKVEWNALLYQITMTFPAKELPETDATRLTLITTK